MTEELYKRYRPSSFQSVLGQDDAVRCLIDMGKRKAVPHCLLFVGPSGVGKTTLARILRKKLGCGDSDFRELNAADFRGIDMVRDIRGNMSLAPISGRCRVWIVDECFAAGTLVETDFGSVPIENICVGDVVFNVGGSGCVSRVFRNRVPLDRVVKLHFSDGTTLFTTKQHEFLTEHGWVEAQCLDDIEFSILTDTCYNMGSLERRRYSHVETLRDLQKPIRGANKTEDVFQTMCLEVEGKVVWEGLDGTETETSIDTCMRLVQEGIQYEESWKASTEMLFQELCFPSVGMEKREWKDSGRVLPGVWNGDCIQKVQSEDFLWVVMCPEKQAQASRSPCCYLQRRCPQKNIRGSSSFFGFGERKENCEVVFGKDEEKESDVRSECFEKNDRDETCQWNVECMEGNSWREWEIHRIPIAVVGGTARGVEVGVCDSHGCSQKTRLWVSDELQGGFGRRDIVDGCRGRWDRPSVEKCYIARCQKDEKARRIRVDRVEVYERGNNDSSFMGVIGNCDRRRGFVEFFDLQVNGHPSYFAGGIPVHNCHQLTSDAQNGFLKLLEDTPKHVYFMLSTTDPQKLKKTIITRSTEIKLVPLARKHLDELVSSVSESEDVALSEDVRDKLVDQADGSARKVLVLLHAIIGLETEEEQLEAIAKGDHKAKAIELARALLNPRSQWSDVAKILKGVEEEPEQLRYMVLGYCRSVLLGGGKMAGRAALIMERFEGNFYDGKSASLVLACYDVVVGEK